MSTLNITFTTAFPSPPRAVSAPVPVGSSARSEAITMPGMGNLTAAAGETIVECTADADCWAAFGADPDPAAASDGTRAAHFLKADDTYSFWIEEGHKVKVEAA
jgi:hypothetical protein